jgi:hypothetical protein
MRCPSFSILKSLSFFSPGQRVSIFDMLRPHKPDFWLGVRFNRAGYCWPRHCKVSNYGSTQWNSCTEKPKIDPSLPSNFLPHGTPQTTGICTNAAQGYGVISHRTRMLELQLWLHTIQLSCYGQTITALSFFLLSSSFEYFPSASLRRHRWACCHSSPCPLFLSITFRTTLYNSLWYSYTFSLHKTTTSSSTNLSCFCSDWGKPRDCVSCLFPVRLCYLALTSRSFLTG